MVTRQKRQNPTVHNLRGPQGPERRAPQGPQKEGPPLWSVIMKSVLKLTVFLSMNDYLFSIAQCAGKESIQYSGYKFYAFYIPFSVVKRFH